MLEALKEAGYLDGMKVHGWDEHNGYHAVFSARASKAASVRWSKEKDQKKDKTGKDKKGKERSKHEPSMLQACRTKEITPR